MVLTKYYNDDRLCSLKGEDRGYEVTVAVACNLAEGVVLGVDSAVTMSNQQGQIIKTYEHAVKLFQLGEKPVGIATYGMGALGNRIIGSYVREFEMEDPEHVVTRDATMEDIVEQLRNFFLIKYRDIQIPIIENQTGKKFEDIPNDDKPALGLAVGGFSAKAYLSQVWEIIVPVHETPNSAKLWCGEGDFKPVWFALNEPIFRYHKGYDRNLLKALKEYFTRLRGSPLTQAEDGEITGILKRHEYRVPFGGMPIEDGIAYVRFLVDMVVNHHRYTIGAPVVGGKVQIGKVTYKGEKFQILGEE